MNATEALLHRGSPFGNETGTLPLGEFYPGEETSDYLKNEANVLVIGAGGLGCELLKDLALSGFKKLEVIDLDTIDVTNLNRQFLFRKKDVGKMKAEVAAAFVMERVPGVCVTAHTCPIQEKPVEFYKQFSVIIAGLDNIKARRWINALLHDMLETDEDGNIIPESAIPLIDGGTEAFKGQARMIVPGATSCFECSMESFPRQTHYPLCTVAETPRKPDHCIAYVLFAVNRGLSNENADIIRKEFERLFGTETKLDKDSPDHMRFIYEKALERSKIFHIEGVTYMLTMGVVKNIIPAIASTNAVIAAACVNEAFKALSWCSQSLNTYFMYNGTTGMYTHTFKYEKKEGCPVCDPTEIKIDANKSDTLEELINKLIQNQALQLEKPSLAKPGLSLYMQKPAALREATSVNLSKKLSELIADGDILSVTDPVFPTGMRLDVLVRLH